MSADWIWYGIECYFCFAFGWLLYDIFKPWDWGEIKRARREQEQRICQSQIEAKAQLEAVGNLLTVDEARRQLEAACVEINGPPMKRGGQIEWATCSYCGSPAWRDSAGRCKNCGAA